MTTPLLLLFLNAFVASTIVPAASEATLWLIVADNPALLWPAIAVASAGNTAGSAVNWALGRFLSGFSNHKWYPLKPEQQRRASAWFQRFGLWSLLFAWLPIVGDPLTVAAGMLRVRFAIFLALVAVGKAGRYVIVALTATAI
ncbi:MAG: YqaA family protein [Alphaproteobacteria bacterium]|jgi:membrane protein YqaA with SNARE-associated domain|nr:YqaA family protein [Alphaproteobacteria bacterium]